MRRRLLIAVAAAFAVAVAVAVWARPSPAPTPEFVGSSPPVRMTLPGFSLHDHKGRPLGDADVRGKVVLVTFLETKCTEACPIVAAQIREGLARLDPQERDEIAAIAISTHPGDDTPESVGEFLARHRVAGALRYLIGTEAELRPVWEAFAVLPALDSGSANIHSAPVRVFDRDGTWVSTLHSGADLTPEALVNDVRAAAAAG
jgi:protein SCO1/2